jgi:SAM-dependent methyltransferase
VKPHFARLLRCPVCRGEIALDATEIQERPIPEVRRGWLVCSTCQRRYEIRDGIPWMAPRELVSDPVTARTGSSFGHLWSRSLPTADKTPPQYHFEKMARALNLSEPHGRVLDAGCGEGVDLRNRARASNVEVIGAELSEGGCRVTAERIADLPNAHVVQADLTRLPFDREAFDYVYSYGVLHHLVRPEDGLAELRRVTRPGAPIVLYLYEDFSDRSTAWRILLAAGNLPRAITTRLPHAVLYRLCQAASPFVFAGLTLPHRVLRRVPLLRPLADSLPFRHGRGPFSLAGDLYDRFSAPVEYRYSRDHTIRFVENAGLTLRAVAKERGWMALAERTSG